MTPFLIFASLLLLCVVALVCPPLWRTRRLAPASTGHQAATLAIFRDQLAELEREQRAGTLAAADFAQARQELQRRLLEEVGPAAGQVAAGSATPSRKMALAILLLLPVLGLLGYGLLGNPQALDAAPTTAQPAMTAEQIDDMVGKLATRLEAAPDDLQGWLMLARSYKTMGRYEDAVNAYSKAEKIIADAPDLLASYAETIALATGRGLQGKPRQLIERALNIDPQHGRALFLAGAAALEAGENQRGIAYWEALLAQVEPGSEIDGLLRSGIAKMQQAR